MMMMIIIISIIIIIIVAVIVVIIINININVIYFVDQKYPLTAYTGTKHNVNLHIINIIIDGYSLIHPSFFFKGGDLYHPAGSDCYGYNNNNISNDDDDFDE